MGKINWVIQDDILTVSIKNPYENLIYAYLYDDEMRPLKIYEDTLGSDPIIFKFPLTPGKKYFYLILKNPETQTMKSYAIYESSMSCLGYGWVWDLRYETF